MQGRKPAVFHPQLILTDCSTFNFYKNKKRWHLCTFICVRIETEVLLFLSVLLFIQVKDGFKDLFQACVGYV